MAMLKLCLMATSNVRIAETRGWVTTLVMLKKECAICKAFMPEQVQQLGTPTYRSRKEREQKKTVYASRVSDTPTLMDPSDVTLLGPVDRKQSSATEKTPAGKKKRPDENHLLKI